MNDGYPRDLIGYGAEPPHAQWPGQAKVCISLVIAVEEGSEYSILHGDAHSESILSEVAGLTPLPGQREVNIESMYEYGSRAGYWRIMRSLTSRGLPATVYAVAMALERNPAAGEAAVKAGFEVMSHGYRWINYHGMDEALEREHMEKAVDIIARICGKRPVGWCTGRPSMNTRRLVVEEGGFLYDSDSLSDDLPYWET
ncbi:MAG: polysaccharide deacetylase family protein, partial [Alphaproteobacteria bacterium]